MRNFSEITAVNKRAFLNRFAEVGRIDKAAELAGCGVQSHYHWLKEDSEYAVAFGEAKVMVADRLEAEGVRRAYEGIDKPIYYKGRRVDTIKEYSDALLMFLLKGMIPEKYREKMDIKHSGAIASGDSLSETERAAIRAALTGPGDASGC